MVSMFLSWRSKINRTMMLTANVITVNSSYGCQGAKERMLVHQAAYSTNTGNRQGHSDLVQTVCGRVTPHGENPSATVTSPE